jgi:hypothetical protein
MTTARGNALLSLMALNMALLGDMTAAQAKLVQWNLEDVAFADGGTATGFFMLDLDEFVDEPPPVVDYDIKVSGGSAGYPTFEYTPANQCFRNFFDGTLLNLYGQLVAAHCGSENFSARSLRLNPGPLTSAGGTVSLGGGEYYPTRCCRAIVRGALIGSPVPVPEPSTTLFLLATLSSLLASTLRRLQR